VKTFNQNEQLTHIGCAGIIDADNRTEEQIEQLSEHKIYPLKFNEIENVLLHPQVTAAICKIEKYDAQSMSELQDKIKNQLFALAQKEGEMDQAALRFTKRQVDNGFKSLDFAVTDSVDMLDSLLSEFITTIKSHEICEEYKVKLSQSINDNDIGTFLTLYSNKGMVEIVARNLTAKHKNAFEQWVVRMLSSSDSPDLKVAVQSVLPIISS